MTQSDEHREQFLQAEKLYRNNLLFNQHADEAASEAGAVLAEDAYKAAEQSDSLMGGLFTGLASMLEQALDSLYYGEYTLLRYTSFQPEKLRTLLTGGDTKDLSQALSFHNQEAEYILYGFNDPIANLAAAYGELFAVRLAIRTMEGLIASRSLGHPLIILSAALIYGLEKTIEDMLSFTKSWISTVV